MATRKCISCRVSGDKADLLRIAFNAGWFFDFMQIAQGRAIYVHLNTSCLKSKSLDRGWFNVLEKLKADGKMPGLESVIKPELDDWVEEGMKKLDYYEGAGVNTRKIKWAKSKLALVLCILPSLKEGTANKKSLGKKLLRL